MVGQRSGRVPGVASPLQERLIFEGAVALEDPRQRAEYLERQCGSDARLRARVEMLLSVQPKLGDFLQRGCPGTEQLSDADLPEEQPGQSVGAYKLLQKIGEGGFGVVYLAEQQGAVRRNVAVKIIKPGMDSRQVIVRFEAERQALAMMEHPHIARVLDAGTTPTGRPYFVMELVRGSPITEYCDRHRLSLEERLRLFVPVCRAIQHAHQKGVIHRDIKPSNILVSLCDGEPAPKVIDFGVAKAIDHRLTEHTMFTRIGQVIGTLEYMSPEQAEMGSLDIDTRSDVYGLGVLLYELLTGSTPLQPAILQNVAFDEVLRRIREEEPARPSTRLAQSSVDLETIATRRSADPHRLRIAVRGELDWIVMKALDKSRARRYATANDLASDLERYLAQEPVLACPPSILYRCRKFAGKRLLSLAAACSILLCLLIGASLGIWQAAWATRAAVSLEQERDDARRARDEARSARDAEATVRQKIEAAYVRLADEQRRSALAQARAVRNEARLAVEMGDRLIERKQIREGLLWLAQGLDKLPEDERVLRTAIRLKMAAVWADVPPAIDAPQPFTTRLLDFDAARRLTEDAVEGVKLWDQLSGDCVWTAPGSAGTRQWLGLGPRPELVLAREAGRVQCWNLRENQWSGAPIEIDDSSQVWIGAQGTRLLELSRDRRSAKLHDLTSGKTLGKRLEPRHGFFLPTSAELGCFSPDGQAVGLMELPLQTELAASSEGSVALHRWSADTARPLSEPTPLPLLEPLDRPMYAMGPRGAVLVSTRRVADRMRLQQFDARTGAVLGEPWGDARHLLSFTLSAGQRRAATVTKRLPGAEVQLWELDGRPRVVGTVAVGSRLRKVRFGAAGETVWTRGDAPLIGWSFPEPQLRELLLPHDQDVQAMSLSTDGTSLMTVAGAVVRRWKLPSGDPLGAARPLPLETDDPNAIVPGPGIDTVLATDGSVLACWNLNTGRLARPPIRLPYEIARVQYCRAADRILVVCARDQTFADVRIFDAASGQTLGPPVRFLGVFSNSDAQRRLQQGAVTLSPDGKTLLVTKTTARLQMYSVRGEPLEQPPMETGGRVVDARFSPDGQRVLTLADGRLIEVWDSSNSQRIGTPIALQAPLTAWCIDPRSRILATATKNELKLWNLDTGQPVGRGTPHSGVTAICFQDDGHTLLAAGRGGMVRAWRVSTKLPQVAFSQPLIEALTGMRLGENGTPEFLNEQQRAARMSSWNELLAHLPEPALGSASRRVEALVATDSAGDEYGRGEEQHEKFGWLDQLLHAKRLLESEQEQAAAEAIATAADTVSPPRVAAWLSCLARMAEQNGDVEQAEWYLAKVDEHPAAELHLLQRARLLIRVGRLDEARSALATATEQADSAPILRRIARAYRELGDWEAASASLSRALEVGGSSERVWLERATCRAYLKQWSAAAADLRLAVERQPDHDLLRERLGIALVSADDDNGYRQLCSDSLQRLNLDDYRKRPWTAPRVFVLAPQGLADYQPILGPALDFAAEYPSNCVTPPVLGAFCYRAQDFSLSARQLPTNAARLTTAEDWIFLAMAEAQMGNLEAARRHLKAATDSPVGIRNDVWQRQRRQLLMSEARDLIPEQ